MILIIRFCISGFRAYLKIELPKPSPIHTFPKPAIRRNTIPTAQNSMPLRATAPSGTRPRTYCAMVSEKLRCSAGSRYGFGFSRVSLGEREDRKNGKRMAPVSAQRNVNVVPEPRRQGNMPSAPEVRHRNRIQRILEKELHNRRIRKDEVQEGILRFMQGLFKKVLIANQIGALWEVDAVTHCLKRKKTDSHRKPQPQKRNGRAKQPVHRSCQKVRILKKSQHGKIVFRPGVEKRGSAFVQPDFLCMGRTGVFAADAVCHTGGLQLRQADEGNMDT